MPLSFLQARLRSIGYAIKGIGILLRTQHNAWLHGVATVAIVLLGFFLHFLLWEWIAVLLCMALVWGAEALNTALEFLADEVDRNHRPGIGKAKDVAAAGVLIGALISLLVGGLIVAHHLFY